MPLSISPYAIAMPLLFDEARPAPASPAISHPVEALADQASSRNHEAIEMLLNLTVAAKAPAARADATRALLDLYRQPATAQDVRESIGQQALALVEASDAPGSSYATLGARLPVSLLYLAGLHAHRYASGTEAQIEGRLRATLGGPGSVLAVAPREKLLSFGRSVGDSEMTLACAGLEHLARHDSSVTPGEHGFTGHLAEAARRASAPLAVFVNLPLNASLEGSARHWGLLVLHPRQDDPRRAVDCLFMDTNDRPDGASASHQAVLRALEADLGGQLGPVQFCGGCLQGVVPDACGPLVTLAAARLDATLAREPQADFDTLCESMEAFTQEWTALTDAQKQAHVAAQRGLMLECVDQANARVREID